MTWLDTAAGSRLKRYRFRVIIGALLAAAAFFALAMWVLKVTAPPEAVDSLTIENPTEFSLSVAVSDESTRSWLPLGVVPPGTERVFPGVFEQGQVWVFRFRSQGVESAEYSFGRDELEASSWVLVVPDSVSEDLRAGGAEPAP